MGIWVSVDGTSFLKVMGSISPQVTQFVNVGYFCIAIGAVLVLLGFLGCCGAKKESKCLLIMFFTIVLIIFIAEVAAAVVALVYSSFADSLLKAWAGPALQTQYGKDKDVTQIWNTTMQELKCCGLDGYGDFNNSVYYNTNGKKYPPYCCNQNSVCTLDQAKSSNIEVRGRVVV
ncbi:TSN1 protein, partial [Amia calva]|nr:TSN1 protein [Amia calva]